MRRLIVLLFCAWTAFAQPQRILSTAPSITETLFALGLGDRVAGVTSFCHYPPEARKKPVTGTWLKPNLEAVLAAQPDLVIVQKTRVHSASELERLGLKTLEVRQDSIADIYRSIEIIAAAAGVPERAARLNASIRAGLEAVRRKVSSRKPRSMMFIVARTPGSLDGLIAVGPVSYLSEVITLAGGRNVFNDSPAAYPKISPEEILARDPEVIIDMGDMADTTGVTEEHKRSVVELWNRFPGLQAVRNHNVHAVASDIFVVPGPRVVDLAREFARILHPELFP
ncbi:MAG: ABC transporter substrate-binding protein [Bryobacteraceae bacterium]